MNARSRPLYSMGLGLGRISLIYVPGAWLGVMTFGYSGILGAAVASNVLTVAAALWCLSRTDLKPRPPAQLAIA
ncbi:MAG: MATE family efflux transporter, partial [Pseudomonadota bacterium]